MVRPSLLKCGDDGVESGDLPAGHAGKRRAFEIGHRLTHPRGDGSALVGQADAEGAAIRGVQLAGEVAAALSRASA